MGIDGYLEVDWYWMRASKQIRHQGAADRVVRVVIICIVYEMR
jgi:hypothetical protein